MSDKNILEKALLQVNQLEEAVKQNAQGILASTMKQELKDLLKESEKEEVETEAFESTDDQVEDQENEMSEQFDDESEEDENTDTETEDEMADDEFGTEDVEDETDTDLDSEDETSFGDDTMDDVEDEEDVLDMTNSPDEDVLKVFKSMKPEDGIIVKKDGDDISLEMDNDDYIIKLDGDDETVGDTEPETEVEPDFSTDDELEGSEDDTEEEGEEETIYEIDLGGDSSEGDYIWFGKDGEGEGSSEDEVSDEELSEEESEEEIDEASRTFANDVRKPSDQSKKFKAGRPELNEALKQIDKLKKQNGLYKQTIVAIKDKLNEIALFNSNLTYSTKLFTEHSTTRKEKKDILRRFDSMTTITESTNLYKSIKTELETNKPLVSESVVNDIKSTNNNSSNDLLSESKAYENPQLERIKQLMGWSQK